MDRYDTRRQELFSVVYALTETVAAFAPTDQHAWQQLEQAEKLLKQSAVNLAVVGAEGHGKSSLIDAIVGADVVPREAQHPGTVAPVLILWHPTDEIQYSVGLDDTYKPTACTDVEQFRRFILQRFNPHNERGVRFGLVQCNNPLLADGLRLVDMPGLEGVSETVNAQVQEELADIEAVIVVIRDRQYGAACRLIEKFQPHLKIQAVVCNWSLDFWIDKSDDVLQSQIEQQKQIVLDELSTTEVKINRERIFVLHVPSISYCRLLPEATTTYTPHIQEIERFRQWVTHYLDEDRVTHLLAETKSCVYAVIAQLEERLRNHRQFINNLQQSDKHQRQQARKSLKNVHKSALKQWQKVVNSPEIADSVVKNWLPLRDKLKLHRDSLLYTFHRTRSSLPPPAQWNSGIIADLVNQLRPAFVAAEEEMLRAQADSTLSLAKQLRETSDQLLAEAFEAIPILAGALDSLQIRGNPLLDFTHPDPGPNTFLEVFSTRRIVERIINAYRTQAEAIDATHSGTAYKSYIDSIADAKQKFCEALEARFQQKYIILEEETELLQTLPDGRILLDAVAEQIAQVKAFINAIV